MFCLVITGLDSSMNESNAQSSSVAADSSREESSDLKLRTARKETNEMAPSTKSQASTNNVLTKSTVECLATITSSTEYLLNLLQRRFLSIFSDITL